MTWMLLSRVWPAGTRQTLFEVWATVTRGVTGVIILPKMFVLLGNPVFNNVSQV